MKTALSFCSKGGNVVDWSKVQYQCGCGYKTRSADNAETHVKQTCHQMTVSGIVLPDDEDRLELRLKKMKGGD